MNFVIAIILCVIAAILLVVALSLLRGAGKRDLRVSLDDADDVQVTVRHTDEGVKVDVVYGGDAGSVTEDRPLDEDEINSAAPAEGTVADRAFWMKVASLDNLDPMEKEKILKELQTRGFISKGDVKEELFPEDPDDSGIEGDTDPTDAAAYEAVHPSGSAWLDIPGDGSLENFDL